jgi:hypothetical protein
MWHDAVQGLHAPHSDSKQSTGHSALAHCTLCAEAREQVPKNDACTTVRERLRVAAPQVAEHAPQLPHTVVLQSKLVAYARKLTFQSYFFARAGACALSR